jgi:hypothetical protein
MPHGFDAYRVFISAPGDLERDRQACHDAIAQANETTAMPAKILLVEVGLRENEQISGHRSIVSDNVRWSTYFVQLFEDDWGPRDLFRKLFLLATECRDDATMPMREVVVFLKDAPRETDSEILAFRREMEESPGVRVFRYSSVDALQEHLTQVCNGWARDLIEGTRVGAGSSETPTGA